MLRLDGVDIDFLTLARAVRIRSATVSSALISQPSCNGMVSSQITSFTCFQLQRDMSTNWWIGPQFPCDTKIGNSRRCHWLPSGSCYRNIIPFYSSTKAQEVRVNRYCLVFLTACKTRLYLPETDCFAIQRLIHVRGTPVLHVLVKDPCQWQRLSRC